MIRAAGVMAWGLASASVADGRCRTTPPPIAVLTAPGATLSTGGGVVIYSDTGKLPAWRAHGGKPLDHAAVTAIAPGLFRIAAPAGDLTLDGADGKPVITVHRAPTGHDLPALAAPHLVSVDSSEKNSPVRVQRVIAELDGHAPVGAIALVIYAVGDHGNVALSWADLRVAPPAENIYIMFAASHCEPAPEGAAAALGGEHVVVAWVDASGRESPPSAPVTVVDTSGPQ
jgi:hypothetical protein